MVVTDSTASLPPGVAQEWGIEVVPLEVMVDGARHHEGVDLTAAELLAALSTGRTVTTSQPSPAAFARAYARAADRGAREIVSVHVSGELSGTVRAAELAALAARVPVHVVDSRSVAMGLGLAAVEAARVVAGATGTGAADGAAAAERARRVAASATTLFLVESLEHLRRGGRVGAAAAAMGTVLGLRPLLGVRSGRIEVVEKVRTRAAARNRLEAIAATDCLARGAARVVVHHLGQPDVAAALARRLEARLGAVVSGVEVSEISAVVAVHAGPGLLAVVVADR
ncbi:DegV family protein [Pengzhenrongella sicca]|uniref:DegV family EDD domain-containing protein n=1 Tax=Pengzhenrongella sicca TaxID=2819238 RepID=A0A8A4ZDE0_9MICO|nr:DegV family protein [Pengzhenrongella sicca]QTE28497.1 DegV family EDD domain-containing protein [Pengzhenrongella sicca]